MPTFAADCRHHRTCALDICPATLDLSCDDYEATERTSYAICHEGWRRVTCAPPEQLAQLTADAWNLEAIHATTKLQRQAAKQAAAQWRAKVVA